MSSSALVLSPLHAAAAGLALFGLGAAIGAALAPAPAPAPAPAAPAAKPTFSLAGPEHEHCRRAAAGERAGRTRAERALRDHLNSGSGLGATTPTTASPLSLAAATDAPAPVPGGYPALPIGHIESPFVARNGTPRQGMLAPDARAHLVFSPAIPGVALDGLASFSHVFVLFVFHENTNLHKHAAPPQQQQQQRQQAQQQARAQAEQALHEADDTAGEGTGESGASVRNPWQRQQRQSQGQTQPQGPGSVRGTGRRLKGGHAHALSLAGSGGASALDDALRARLHLSRVEAPALRGGRVGVFGSRSPHRPNAIGLTMCRLVSVHVGGGKWAREGQRVLVLQGCDLVHGTPVLDVKPVIPLDCPRCLGRLLLGDEEREEPPQAPPPPQTLSPQPRAALGAGMSEQQAREAFLAAPLLAVLPPDPFVPARDLAAGQAALAAGADFAREAFTFACPAWVMSPLLHQASSRLAVVWGPGTTEALCALVAQDECYFYGPSSLSRRSPGADAGDAGIGDAGAASEAVLMARAITQALALDIRSVRNGRGGRAKHFVPEQDDDNDGNGAAVGTATAAAAASSAPVGPEADGASGGQRMNLFFDALHVRFSLRDISGGEEADAGAAADEGEDPGVEAARGDRVYVQIESVVLAQPWPR